MKIFFDIGHPAHVHYFKYLIHELQNDGHLVVITARDKEMTHYLLQNEDLDFISRGKGGDGLIRKLMYLIKADILLLKIAKKEKPDLFLSFASPYCSHVAWLMGKPCITLDDTETASLNHNLYKPFTTNILTPQSFLKEMGKKQIRFPSFMELSYLHPNRFKPDLNIYQELGLKSNESYTIVRFVAWKANHDVGQTGLSVENRIKAVAEFSKYSKVFISSENELPTDLKKYRIEIDPKRIHHALAFCSLFFGESGTMTSECAMLGAPAILINKKSEKLGTIRDQEYKYGLVFSFGESADQQTKAIEKGVEILKLSGKDIWREKQQKLLRENIDLSNYLRSYLVDQLDI